MGRPRFQKRRGLMQTSKQDRRTFLRQASVFAVAFPLLATDFALIGCNQAQSSTNPALVSSGNIPWKTTIVSEGEPGEPMIITGTIFAPDGRTPLEGITLSVYQ